MSDRILSMEEIGWAYDVVGSGRVIRILCELKVERDALRKTLEEINRMPYAFGAAKKARDALDRFA